MIIKPASYIIIQQNYYHAGVRLEDKKIFWASGRNCLWLLQARLFDQSYTWTSCVVKRCLLLLLLRTHTHKIKEKDGAFISLCLLIWMNCELNKLLINEESNVRDRDKVYLGMYWARGSVVAQSCPTLATPWTVACQVPLSIGLSRQEYWSGYLCPSLGDLPDPWIKPRSPALQTDTLPSEPAEEPHRTCPKGMFCYEPKREELGELEFKPGWVNPVMLQKEEDKHIILCVCMCVCVCVCVFVCVYMSVR